MGFAVNENLSKRINSLRFLLIVFVVIIHNGISAENFLERGIKAAIPAYVENVQRFIGIVTAIAVPMFFLFSAVLLYTKENTFISMLKKKSKTILLPYFLWTILLILFYFIVQTTPFTRHFFSSNNLIASWGLSDWIKAFFGNYIDPKYPLLSNPFVGQFWFLRDLFILNILFLGIKKLVDKFPLGTFVLFLILWVNNIKIYIVSPEALLFFTFGYYVVKYNLDIINIDRIKISDLAVIYVITIILGYFSIKNMIALPKISIIIGCIFFLKISQYFIENIKLYKTLAWLEKQQFAIYAVHMVIISQLLKIYTRIIPLNGVYILFGYFFVILLGVFVSLAFGIIFKKLFPKTYGVLTGGRI
jgi:fucose 4-O-acetylase-like acetyltransferase